MSTFTRSTPDAATPAHRTSRARIVSIAIAAALVALVVGLVVALVSLKAAVFCGVLALAAVAIDIGRYTAANTPAAERGDEPAGRS